MATASAYDDKARIYALANPGSIFEESEAIQRAVFEALEIAPSNTQRLTISESSAWLDYTAIDQIWDRKTPPALPNQAAALRAAEGRLQKLEQKCSDANRRWPERLRGIALLPPMRLLRRAGLHAVARPDGSAWDHWLYRAEPQLQLDGTGQNKAGVFGAQIEIRIGHLGQPIGVCSRWRPLSSERTFTDLSPFQPTTEDHDDRGHRSDETPQPPIINFLLEGDGIPQYYLAPYYFQSDGHSLNMSSASPWSLTVEIGRTKQQESRMTLTALAQGGSGDYIYNWAMYSLPDFDKGFRELGRGRTDIVKSRDGAAKASSLQFDNGHYIVMLNVKDRATGAFKHHQQQVFSSAFKSPPGSGQSPLSL